MIEDSKAAWQLMLKKKKSGTDTSKIPITVKDVNRCTFTVLVDSTSPQPPLPSPEFAGIACDPIPTTSIEEVEYEGWFGGEEELVSSVDWNQHYTPAAKNTFTVEPLNQTKCTQMSLDNFPFIVDSGASVHIS